MINSSFELISDLQYCLVDARRQIQAFKSGEKYVQMTLHHQSMVRYYERQIRGLKRELAAAHRETVTVRKLWMQTCEDIEAEKKRDRLYLERELAKMEARALKAEAEVEKEKEKNAELRKSKYEVETALEEEKGKNQKLTAQLNRDYENSSIPSSLSRKPKKKVSNSREQSERKPGGQPGHKGHTRKRQEPTSHVMLQPEEEILNDPDFKKTNRVIKKQLVALKVMLDVVEYEADIYYNSKTGEYYHAPFPEGVVNDVNYDGSIKAFLYLLNNECCVSIDKCSRFLSDLTAGKWETFSTMADAKKRKAEIETQQEDGTFQIPTCTTLDELLEEYVQTYGVNTWALSTYEARKAMIENYISPIIGDMKLTDITPRVMDQYYRNLLQVKSVAVKFHNPRTEFVTPSRIREIHKLLSTAFKHAVKWDLISRNPVENATLPKEAKKERAIWTAENLMHALEICDDEMLYLAINLAFSCSLRIGEMLGLTWDCVEISEESIRNGEAYIFVNKELQRASRDAMEALDDKDVIFKFPPALKSTHTCLLLKTPKTKTSVRKVFLPKTVAELLIKQKAEQEEYKELFGDEYLDYNLVFAGVNGRPVEGQLINKMFRDLIEKGNLPKVVFHSLRHSSITYKLKLTGGNLKSVQGDSGHAQTKMITDVYSHIIDDDRKLNAQKFEQVFYSGKKKEDEIPVGEPEAEIESEVIEETTFIPDSASEVVAEEVVEKATETVTQAEAAPAPRKRGRPRKVVQEAPAEVKEESVTETTTTPAADKELLLKLLEKPEMAQLLKALAQTL